MSLPPRLLDHLDAARRTLADRPSGLFVDVDGTISPIAPRPEEAIVPDRVRRTLETLADQIDLVVALSGRTAADVRRLVGAAGLVYVGNHGLERLEDGRQRVAPAARRYRARVGSALRAAAASLRLPGLIFEDKGLTGSIHYRLAADPAAARATILATLATMPEAAGLAVRAGRMVVELRPPIRADKGTAVRELVRRHGLHGAIYLGDDSTDVDAVRALRQLRQRGGCTTLTAVVLSAETPSALVEAADYRLASVDEAHVFLEQLARPSA